MILGLVTIFEQTDKNFLYIGLSLGKWGEEISKKNILERTFLWALREEGV